MPESTTQLTTSDIERIEARKAHQYGTMVSLPVAERDALIRDWRALKAENLRLLDLVRYGRHQLHDEGLITDAEFAALVEVGADSARRLESYDALREQLAGYKQCVTCACGRPAWHRKEDNPL